MAETDKSRVAEEAPGPTRKPGFYWVRFGDEEPQIAYWGDGYRGIPWWHFAGSDDTEHENRNTFTVLSDRLEPPPQPALFEGIKQETLDRLLAEGAMIKVGDKTYRVKPYHDERLEPPK